MRGWLTVDVGQPRFFLFPGKSGRVFSRFPKGRKPAFPCEAGIPAFGNRTRSQPRQRGCSRGLGCYPNKHKRVSGGNAGSPFGVFVHTKTLLAK